MMYITFKGVRYEVPYNRDTLKLNMAIDSTFDNGFVKTVHLGASSGLDFSRRIPRGLLVDIELDGIAYTFKTGETSMDKVVYGTTPKYEHSINLISLSKELTKKTLENITLKQPKGDLGIYSRSVNRGVDFEVNSINDDTWIPISYISTVDTNTSKTTGVTVVSPEEYKIAHTLVIEYEPPILPFYYDIRFKFNGVVIREEEIKLINLLNPFAGTRRTQHDSSFNHTPTTTGTYSVEIKKRVEGLGGDNQVENISFSITGLTIVSKPVRTYAQLVDKMLRNTNYVLSSQSRSKLFLTAPEGKYEGYMLYDGLQKIGSELGALVRVGGQINRRYWGVVSPTTEDISGDSLYDFSPYDYDINTILKIGAKYYKNQQSSTLVREITYDFFDNPKTFEPIGERNRTEVAEFEDYVSALELNTKNVIKPIRYSPFKNGWGTLRNLDGIGQMTTQNIGYLTEDKQERIIKVLVKGLASQSTSHTWTVNDVTDITPRVLEKRQYDTFPSEAIYDIVGKQQYLKNNTLYYVQGDNKIYGMSYVGEKDATFIGNPDVNRAVYETILATRTVEVGELVTRTGTQSQDDPGLPGDMLLQFQITYENQTESRARVYKKDQSGFDEEYIKYINESSNVNETSAIGDYAAQMVNRMGGTKIIVDGVVESISDIANLGDMDALGRVYTAISLEFGKRITYTYTLVQDYNIISSYIGVNSRHRVEEISSDSSTRRTLRYISKLIFKNEIETFSTRLVNPNNIVTHLLGNSLYGLNYGYIEFYHSNGDTRRVHTSVDTDSKGQTIEIKWNMFDNYSAGLKRYTATIGGETVYLNSEVPYTDYYGKVSDILFSIYDESNHTYDKSSYPEAVGGDGDNLFTIITDTIDKDEGETLSGLIEIPIFSENDKIRVYNGFAKFNAIMGGTNRLQAVALNYVPLIKDNKIDLSRVNQITVTGTMEFGEITINTTLSSASKGIAWYNIDTLDIVLCYIEDLPIGANEIKMPYIIEDSLYGGGENITFNVTIRTKLNVLVGGGNKTSFTLQGIILGGMDVVLGEDITFNVAIQTQLNALVGGGYKTSFTLQGSISSDIDETTSSEEPYWDTTPSTAYDGSVQLNTGSANAVMVTMALTSAYPPSNYSFGFVMRCRVYSLDGNTLLGTTYRERKVR